MSITRREVLENREVRDLARSTFNARLALVKSDLDARGVGGRIAHSALGKAKHGVDGAKDIAGEHKGVVAGTIAALAVWFLRNPIIAWTEGFLGSDSQYEDDHYDRDDFATPRAADERQCRRASRPV